MQKGHTHRLKIRCSDKNFDPNLLTWVSNNEKVVSVDNKGNVTAKSTGTAEVGLCLGNTIVDKIKITVK